MKPAQRIVFRLTPVQGLHAAVADLARRLPLEAALEFSRLAVPHRDAPNALEVLYLLTLWFKKGKRANRASEAMAHLVKQAIPGAQFMANADIAVLNARVREVEAPVFAERVFQDFYSLAPWARPYLEGDIRPSLLSVTWQPRAKPTLRTVLREAFFRTDFQTIKARRAHGRISGLVRYFGTKKFGDQRCVVELEEPLLAAKPLHGLYNATPFTAEDFSRVLPIDELDSPAQHDQSARFTLVDQTGQARFFEPFARERPGHWVLALQADKRERVLTELRALAQEQGLSVTDIAATPGQIAEQPFSAGCEQEPGAFSHAALWRLFYAQRFLLEPIQSMRLEAALRYALQKHGVTTSWADVREEALQLALRHPGLDTLAAGQTLMLSEIDQVLSHMVLQTLQPKDAARPGPRVVVLPPISGRCSPLQEQAFNFLSLLLRQGRGAGICYVVQLTDAAELPPPLLRSFCDQASFVVAEPNPAAAKSMLAAPLEAPDPSTIALRVFGQTEGLYRLYDSRGPNLLRLPPAPAEQPENP